MPYLIVQPGDTLKNLSQENRVSYQRLLSANPQIENPNAIFPGQVIILPIHHQRNPIPAVQRVVRPGDTMFFIAKEFGVPLQQVIKLNPQVRNPDLIYPGMILAIKHGQPCPKNVIDFVNSFLAQKTGSHHSKPGKHLTVEAIEGIDPRLLTGISEPFNSDYDFLSCYKKSHHQYAALVAIYRKRRGVPGIYDIVLEQIFVSSKDGRFRIQNINVLVVLKVGY